MAWNKDLVGALPGAVNLADMDFILYVGVTFIPTECYSMSRTFITTDFLFI
jgi:hypothetical protein